MPLASKLTVEFCMNDTRDLIRTLLFAGAELWAEGDRLRVRARSGLLTAEVKEALREDKAAILQALPEVSFAVPLSPGQEALWLIQRGDPECVAYNIGLAFCVESTEDPRPALAWAIQQLINRHLVLRATFPVIEGRPQQVIQAAGSLDLESLDGDVGTPEALQETLSRLHLRPFDLERDPPLRVYFGPVAPGEYALLLCVHHIAADGWSMRMLTDELIALLGAQGTTNPLRPIRRTYIGCIESRHQRLEEHSESLRSYWKESLKGVPRALDLPTDRTRPVRQTFCGGAHTRVLDSTLTQGLRDVARRGGTTLYVALLAAFQVLLHRLSGQADLCIGSPALGREDVDEGDVFGYMVNPIVLRSELQTDDAVDFLAFLEGTRNGVLAGIEHQAYPFPWLAKDLLSERDPSRSPIFQVMVVYQREQEMGGGAREILRGGTTTIGNLRLSSIDLPNKTCEFDLVLDIHELAESLSVTLRYNSDLFEASAAARIVDNFEVLLAAIVADPTQSVARLELIGPKERQELLGPLSGEHLELSHEVTVHGMIERQSAESPEAIAVICGERKLTYGELEGQANQLARYLQRAGVGPGVRVGVVLDRSEMLLLALLAVLKAGGAYVPIDPGYPRERQRWMLSDAEVGVVLTRAALVEGLVEGDAVRVVALDRDAQSIFTEESTALAGSVGAGATAYLLYTSGSTGVPKAVVVEHRSVVAFLLWASATYSREELRGVLASTSICFDISAFELFTPLVVGGTVIVADDALAFSTLPAREQVTMLNMVSSVVVEVIRSRSLPPGVRVVNLAGERVTADVVRRVYGEREDMKIYNVYGPTEATIYATFARIPRGGGDPAIGRPCPGARIYVLDGYLEPVPFGVAGELYIGGIGVARGYYQRPELTAERFIENPFSDGRLYRTGDLVRFRDDGDLEFLGRLDHQIKLRGFRIELGEIEAALERIPDVEVAVVCARGVGLDLRLVAYWTLQAGGNSDPQALRAALAATLPGFMVPEIYVCLDTLPRTLNGKIDRKGLPELGECELQGAEVRAPTTATEIVLVNLWAELLGRSGIGVDADFFALGGHSLLAAQAISRLPQLFQVEMPLRELFDRPTVAGFAARIDEARRTQLGMSANYADLCQEPHHGELPVSPSQRRLWFLSQLSGANVAYNMPMALRLRGKLDVSALRSGLSRIVGRHESLRTSFRLADDGPIQVIGPPMPVDLRVVELSGLDEATRRSELRQRIDAAVHRPFDLEEGPLLRAEILRLAPEEHVFVLVIHHIVADGWSLGVLERELTQEYAAALDSQPSPLPPLPIQYADFSRWQRARCAAPTAAEHLVFWRETLAGAPALELPTDHARPAVESFRGDHHIFVIDRDLTDGLVQLSRDAGVTIYVALLAAFDVLLARYAEQEDFVVASGTANRRHPALEGLIGFFVDTLMIRVDLGGDPTFLELLDRVQIAVLAATEHEDLPFERVVDDLLPERSADRNPLAQVGLTLQNFAAQGVELAGLEVVREEFSFRTAKLDLLLMITEMPTGLEVIVEFNADLFEMSTILRMSGHLQRILEEAVSAPERRIGAIQLVDAAERRLLEKPNQTKVPFSADACIHDLFETWAERTPDALAIVDHCESGRALGMTYAELDRRANQLAHHLRSRGVGAEVMVGLYCDRSAAQIVGLLGILKAGGAFVTLDPDHPDRRLEMMVADTEMSLVVSQARVRQAPAGLRSIDVDRDLDGEPIDRPSPVSGPGNLAYVIYTSGSTGEPNGVLVEHRSLVNSIESDIRIFETGPGSSIAHLTSLNFDAALSHLLVMLCAGGTVHLVPRDADSLGPGLVPLLKNERITHSIMPVAMLAAIEDAELPDLHTIATGADVVSQEVVSRWSRGRSFFNIYGPTEVTITATVMRCVADGRPPPIGRPIANLRAYVVDRAGRLAPLGVPGELYLGGLGVARGYLKRPELTERLFITNPFGDGRVYRTGDRVRWRASDDGALVLEFLGRLDKQVKIRGYRVELSEIEHVLRGSPRVQDAVVVVRQGGSAKQLVAYVVAKVEGHEPRRENERVEYWESMHGNALDRPQGSDPTLDLRGWSSSFTGEALPVEDMRAWVEATVASILAARPRRVLEIGCGTGMLLTRIAPQVEHYHGSDLSRHAVAQIDTLGRSIEGLEGVSTSYGPAREELGRLVGSFDTVVINSVIQYFPSEAYLREVVSRAIAIVDGPGVVFIGDVRSHALLRAYHSAVAAARSGDDVADAELRRRVEQALRDENELVVHPAFFCELAKAESRVCSLRITPKRGDYRNELSLFRYDVTLRIDGESPPTSTVVWQDWRSDCWSLDRLRAVLVDADSADFVLGLRGVPNSRLLREVSLERRLFPEFAVEPAMGDHTEACDPDDILAFASTYGVEVEVSCAAGRDDGSFDVWLSTAGAMAPRELHMPGEPLPTELANDPLGGAAARELGIELRRELSASLPAHLVPSAIVLVPSLPLTINGKVDVHALPPPRVDLDVGASAGEDLPETATERELAAIWCGLLGLDRVGVRDNFFALGGDSIVGMQVVARARASGISLRASQIFEHQTIGELADVAVVGVQETEAEAEIAGDVPLSPIQRWFFARDLPVPHHFNQAVILETGADVDKVCLRRALGAVEAHHDALRHRFIRDGETWTQSCIADSPEIEVEVIDLSMTPRVELAASIRDSAARLQASLDLSQGPVMRAALLRLGDGQPARIVWVIHHLVVDAMSWRVLLEDLETAYQAAVAGEVAVLPAKTTSFKRWSELLVASVGTLDFSAERALMAAPPSRGLPLDHPEAEDDRVTVSVVHAQLGTAATESLLGEALAAYRLRPQELLLTALARSFARWTGDRVLWVDLEGHGREELFEGVDLSRTVGWFTSMFPVRLELPEAPEPGSALPAIKEQVRAVPRRGVGFGLLRYLHPDGAAITWPAPEVSFNYLGRPASDFGGELLRGLASEDVGPSEAAKGPRSHAININVQILGGRLHVALEHAAARIDPATVERICTDFLAEVEALIEHACAPGVGALTPSDVPLVRLDADALKRVCERVGGSSRVDAIYPLTALQAGILFHSLVDMGNAGDASVYGTQLELVLEGSIEVAALRAAWDHLTRAHPLLRSVFLWEGLAAPVQVVLDAVATPWEDHDLRGTRDEESALGTLRSELRMRSISVDEAPLTRFTLVRTADQRYRLFWTSHHIVFDGWSGAVLLRELVTAYRSIVADTAPRAIRSGSYEAYLRWLQGQDQLEAESYWRRTLGGFAEPTPLVVDRRVAGATGHATRSVVLDSATTAALRRVAERERVTLYTVLLGAWGLVLSRYTGLDDVLFGVAASGRDIDVAGIESMVGLFICNIPTRVRIDEDAELWGWLRGLQAEQAEARAHQHLPLVEIQRATDVPAGTQLFESTLVLENFPLDTSALADRDLKVSYGGVESATHYPLVISGVPGAEFRLNVDYACDRFSPATIDRLCGHLIGALAAFADERGSQIAALEIITDAERAQLLRFGEGPVLASEMPSLLDLFGAHVARDPDALAVVGESIIVAGSGRETVLTYGELDALSDRLAVAIERLGVMRGSVVGVCLDRSVELLVAMFALFKCGAVYMPLDPDLPHERHRFMIDDAECTLVLAAGRGLERLQGSRQTIDLAALWPEIMTAPRRPCERVVRGTDPAYMIYTSGSTGRPKGVLISHQAYARFAVGVAEYVPVKPADCVLHLLSPGFDGSTGEFALAFAYGASLHIARRELMVPGVPLHRLLRERRISHMMISPSALRQLDPEGLPDLKVILIVGEAIPPGLLRAWAPGRRLINGYGPTETTICSTMMICEGLALLDEDTPPPIGLPLAATCLRVLDDRCRQVPIGVPGELYIGGGKLAIGYYRRPELTAERFVVDLPGMASGERFYRTGDRVRYRTDGAIEFLGRFDEQVKVRGFRVELGEIEHVLRRASGVAAAAVVVREGRGGDTQLVAYWVASASEPTTARKLRSWLAEYLMEAMLPTFFIKLDELPLNVNGKVDRRKLPEVDTDSFARDARVAPRNPTEAALVAIWSEMLGVPDVGVRDSFFDLGGHSLIAVSLIERIAAEMGERLPVATLFERPTIEALAERFSEGSSTEESPLVSKMRAGGSGPPIFLFAGLGVHHIYLTSLAEAIGGIGPTYGVQPLGPDAELLGCESMAELAKTIVDAIQTIRPEGPYVLVGHSAGARVALAAAELLEARGQRVDLAALDIPGPRPDSGEGVSWVGAGTLIGYLKVVNRALEATMDDAIDRIADLPEEARWAAATRLVTDAGLLPQSGGEAILRRMVAVNRRFVSMVAKYAPATPLRSRVLVVFAARSLVGGREVTTEGWEASTRGEVLTASVSGGHMTMLRSPHVEALAEHIRSFAIGLALEAGPACGFPIAWEEEADSRATWVFDEVHNREPMTPLDFDVLLSSRVHGQNYANLHYGLAVRSVPARFNSYVYLNVIFDGTSPAEVESSLATAEVKVREAAAQLDHLWASSWLPEAQEHLAAIRCVDLGALDLEAHLAHLDDIRRRIDRLWEIHFVLLLPMTVALSDFDDAFRDLFPEAGPLRAYELLAGFPNKTMEGNLGLWRLGKRAAADPKLRVLIEETSPGVLRQALTTVPAGRALWQELVAYLEEFGERNANLYLDAPTWIEDPTPALQALRDAVLSPERDLDGEFAALAVHREARLVEVRAALKDFPSAVVAEFEALLGAAQVATVLREDHNFWLDNKIAALTRQACLALGERLVTEEVLEAVDDVLFLGRGEFGDAATIVARAAELRARVSARRIAHEQNRALIPAPFLGEMIALPASDNAILRANERLSGAFHAPSTAPNEILGLPGSGGIARGRARVIESLADAETLEPGDVLIAPTTLPTWTAYFGRVAAVVTNVGGVLSHAAVVAREYGIPAVVGARGATTAIVDGSLIEVDGDSGTVRIVLEDA